MATELTHVHGLNDLVAKLRALPKELASKNGGPVRRALAKAARVIRDEAVSIVKTNSVDTGALHESISTFRDRDPQAQGHTEIYRVGIRKLTKAAKKKQRIRAHANAGRVLNKAELSNAVKNPRRYAHLLEFGTAKAAPEPFLRPAFEAKKHEAVEVFKAELTRGIELAERKLARQRLGT